MLDEREARRLVDTYADTIFRIGWTWLRRTADAEDLCQTVFLRYIERGRPFEGPDHEAAWIVRTAVNACKDRLKRAYVRRDVPLEEAAAVPAPDPPSSELSDALASLPPGQRICLYLYYYEGRSAKEIGEILGEREATVWARLSRGRKKLERYLTEGGAT